MDTIQWIIIIGLLIGFGLFIWASIGLMKESKKDWETLYALEKRGKEVETKEEIEALHKDLMKVEISNQFIKPRLSHLDGYLRGLYKQWK